MQLPCIFHQHPEATKKLWSQFVSVFVFAKFGGLETEDNQDFHSRFAVDLRKLQLKGHWLQWLFRVSAVASTVVSRLLCEVPLGQAPCGSAVYGKVDEMSPAPPVPPHTPRTPPVPPPPHTENNIFKSRIVTCNGCGTRDFALQLP